MPFSFIQMIWNDTLDLFQSLHWDGFVRLLSHKIAFPENSIIFFNYSCFNSKQQQYNSNFSVIYKLAIILLSYTNP